MATMLGSEKAAYQAALARFVAARKQVSLAVVHNRATQLITDPALSFAWMLAHYGKGSESGAYAGRQNDLRGKNAFTDLYTAPASWLTYKRDRSDVAADRGPEAPVANAGVIQGSVDMTLGAKVDRFIRGWLSYAQSIDKKNLGVDWPKHDYNVVDGSGNTRTVKQTAAYHAVTSASVAATGAAASNLSQAAQAFYNEVLTSAPSWEAPALAVIKATGAPPPRVAIGGALKLSPAIKDAYKTLRDRAASSKNIGGSPQPEYSGGAGGGTEPGGGGGWGQAQQEKATPWLLWLGIAAAAIAAILLLGGGEGKAATSAA